MRKLVTAHAVALLAAAAVLSVSGAASATPSRSNTWIACPDGVASTGQLMLDGAGPGGILEISGQVEPCDPPSDTDVYTVAAYYADDAEAVTWDSFSLKTWYSTYDLNGPSSFAAQVSVKSDLQAICLVTGDDVRVHCYEVTTTSPNSGGVGTPTVGATIPTTDPRVQHAIACPAAGTGDPTRPPACGHCW